MSWLDNVFTGSSTALKPVMFFTKSITPGAVAASIGMKEEAFATIGAPTDMAVTDVVLLTQPPGAVSANIAVIGARVTAAQTITLIYANLTAAANVATAGVYGFLVLRP